MPSSSISASSILLKQNEITLHFATDEPMYVWADEFKVEEVLTNYLSNAIHHVNEDRKIEIKYTKKQDLVRVSVFNTGTPIPEEDIERIWIKFYKVDKARTREYGGSGIGLSIVKKIVEDHGGYIWATSKENEGTCMHFVIRKYQAPPET